MNKFLNIVVLICIGLNAGAATVKFSPCRALEQGDMLLPFCPKGFTMTSESNKCGPGMMCAAVMIDWCVGEADADRVPRCISEDKKLKVMAPCPSGYNLEANHCVLEEINTSR